MDFLLEGEERSIRLPYLVFDYCVSLNKFSPSPYFSKDISDRKELHDKVWELYSEGMGYTKIHQYLIKNDYEIGTSRTTVYHMLKKLKKIIPALKLFIWLRHKSGYGGSIDLNTLNLF